MRYFASTKILIEVLEDMKTERTELRNINQFLQTQLDEKTRQLQVFEEFMQFLQWK